MLVGTGWEPQNSSLNTSLKEEILQSWEYLERAQQLSPGAGKVFANAESRWKVRMF